MRKFFPAGDSLLEMIVIKFSSPLTAQRYRDESALGLRDCNPAGPLVLYVSKFLGLQDSNEQVGHRAPPPKSRALRPDRDQAHEGRALIPFARHREDAPRADANFLKVVFSATVDKHISESARIVREMFGYAHEHEPCIIFMDEIDITGGRRFSEGTSADRQIQRTLMEVCIGAFVSFFGSLIVILLAPHPNGRIRYSGQDEVNYGHQRIGHTRPRPPLPRTTRSQNRDSAARRGLHCTSSTKKLYYFLNYFGYFLVLECLSAVS